jgi:hypothetical protein
MARSTESGQVTRPQALSLPIVQDGKLDKTPVDRRRLFDGKFYPCTLSAAMLVFRREMLIVSLTTSYSQDRSYFGRKVDLFRKSRFVRISGWCGI